VASGKTGMVLNEKIPCYSDIKLLKHDSDEDLLDGVLHIVDTVGFSSRIVYFPNPSNHSLKSDFCSESGIWFPAEIVNAHKSHTCDASHSYDMLENLNICHTLGMFVISYMFRHILLYFSLKISLI
jgi:hypothetical protein